MIFQELPERILITAECVRANLPAGFSAPTHDPRHMQRVLKPKLESVDAGFGIDAMTLEARETAAALVQQHGFLEEDSTLALEQLNDRVLNRHEQPFVALEDVESHIPERAEILKPSARPLKPRPARAAPTARPLLIFEAPEPAKVVAAVPDGPPMRLTWRRVTRVAGNCAMSASMALAGAIGSSSKPQASSGTASLG